MSVLAVHRARPWPERPVSAANKSRNDTAATRQAPTCLIHDSWPRKAAS